MSDVLILIPAAGSSSRMRGRDKLMEEIDGVPLLARQVRRALATGSPVFVTLSRDHPQRGEALAGVADPHLTVTDPPIDGREGMAVSVRAAAALCATQHPEPAGLMILLADLPDLETSDLNGLIAAFLEAPNKIHRATGADGKPGHPVIFPRRLFGRLSDLSGDDGAKAALSGEDIVLHPLPGQRALTDLDTPEEWAAWRAAQHKETS